MTYIFILVTTVMTSTTPGLTEAECRWAVLHAQEAMLAYAPTSTLLSARCEKDPK